MTSLKHLQIRKVKNKSELRRPTEYKLSLLTGSLLLLRTVLDFSVNISYRAGATTGLSLSRPPSLSSSCPVVFMDVQSSTEHRQERELPVFSQVHIQVSTSQGTDGGQNAGHLPTSGNLFQELKPVKASAKIWICFPYLYTICLIIRVNSSKILILKQYLLGLGQPN